MIKVAHILGRLDRGGVETWLKDVILYSDKDKYQMDFILIKEGEGIYDNIVLNEGSRLYIVPLAYGILSFSNNLYELFRKEKFDIVHSHLHFFSGYICFIAFLAGVPVRISHSHNDTSAVDNLGNSYRKLYLKLQHYLISKFSNQKLACSEWAGNALFGRKGFEVLHCGIDFRNFIKTDFSKRNTILEELNIPDNALCVGHVGRFQEQKNHSFLIDIFYKFNQMNPNSYLLLIGDGPLKESIKEKVLTKDLREHVIFLNERNDVNIFMRDVFDVLLFPSLHEGLSIVMLESQMAGLQLLVSDNIASGEVIVIKENVFSMSLKNSSQDWADKLYEIVYQTNRLDYNEVILKMGRSSFNIQTSLNKLYNIYSR